MLTALIRRRAGLLVGAGLLLAVLLALAVVAFGGGADVVVYNGRSQYGDEAAFKSFEDATGKRIELRGGTAPELFERLRSEGSETPADLLVTTDLANLWRAKEAGLLAPVSTPALERQVPEQWRDPDGDWWGLSLRIRTPMRSTSVDPKLVQSYEDLGDPRWKGELCLRTSNNEYNQSFVADMIAKRGADATEELLRSWMANDPTIITSDSELIAAIAAGECDVGLTNHYYLARALQEDPDLPVAPAWPDQDGAGAHANISGAGVVTWTDRRDDAVALIEYLTSADAQEGFTAGGEFAANPEVPPDPAVADWADVTTDPIAVNEAGPLLEQATQLMLDVGWN